MSGDRALAAVRDRDFMDVVDTRFVAADQQPGFVGGKRPTADLLVLVELLN